MSSFERKIKRKQKKRAKKELEKDVATKMNMFDQMPDECSACEQAFDKQNRDMVMTWNVVVREKEKIVRLYCPTCWDKARKIIKEDLVPKGIEIFGPVEAPLFLLRGKYRFRILIKGDNRQKLNKFTSNLVKKTPEPSNVRLIIDVDPYNFV